MQLRKLQFYTISVFGSNSPFTLYVVQQQQLRTTNIELNMAMLDTHY